MKVLLNVKTFMVMLVALAASSALAVSALAATDVEVTDIYTPTSLVALQDTTVTAELTNYGGAGKDSKRTHSLITRSHT